MSNLPGHYFGYTEDRNLLTGGKTDKNPYWSFKLAAEVVCHQEANTFLSRHPATCPSRVRPGRTFVARMYRTAAKDKELTFYIKLNNEFRLDLFWWHYFLKHWNGLSLLCSDQYGSLVDRCIQTDASRIWGCGSTWDNQWFQWPWAEEWREVNIMVKELVPIVISCVVWAPHLTKHRVPFQCDNMSLVRAIQKGNSKEPVIMYLMRISHLWHIIQEYYQHGTAQTTRKTYAIGQCQYMNFCSSTQRWTVPTSESTLLLFASHLAKSGFRHGTIMVYLSAVHHM